MDDRIPYPDLFPDERDQILAWLHEHRIDPGRVPDSADLQRDDTTGEWRIPLYWRDEHGRMATNPDGETVRMLIVRRRELSPLPWPSLADGDCWEQHDVCEAGPGCPCMGEPGRPVETVTVVGGVL
jgi:hypothetical protein